MEKNKLINKITTVQRRLGMYIADESNEGVSVFLLGMDYALDGAMLDGYHEWMRKKHKVRSPFGIGNLEKHIAEKALSDPSEEDLISFLFDNVLEFPQETK